MGRKNKIKVFVARGFELVNAYYDGDFKVLREVIEDCDYGSLVCREFDTEAERDAYCTGLEDAEGHMACAVMEDEYVKKHPRIIKKLCMDY